MDFKGIFGDVPRVWGGKLLSFIKFGIGKVGRVI